MSEKVEHPQVGLPVCLRVCELFAGIGGWRVALEAVLPPGTNAEVIAYDSGPHCSEVYALNFKEQCCRRNIEQLDLAALEGFDLWAMSPPCQPFSTTKEAKRRDIKDLRCKALQHLCGVLPRLATPPRWIILENVKGFHGSEACERWRSALAGAGYGGHEFLLDLASFHAPNHRTRYYLLAERSSRMPSLVRQRGAGVPQTVAENNEGEEHNPEDHDDDDDDAADELQGVARVCGGNSNASCFCKKETPLESLEQGAARLQGEFLPQGVMAQGPWARLRRKEIEAAHQLARAANNREAQEATFLTLRRHFCEILVATAAGAELADASQYGDAGSISKAAGTLADVAEWKLLPLPRFVPDAFLIVFDADQLAPQRLLAELSWEGSMPGVSWSLVKSSVEEPWHIAEYLVEEHLSASEHAELLVPQAVLQRPFARGLSYVEPGDIRSFCFTGHYGKVLHKSSGSLLHLPNGKNFDRNNPAASFGSVRFFSPKEILNMLGFPRNFKLPSGMELRHRYKVVGNSIAVTVASALLRFLLLHDADPLLGPFCKQQP
mmetsp:Transcript_80004/g.185798  ORF Transcript_80004/g.185798 Transcript_80004/m.185798 type:complete len:550 (+) Transcript_80004:103-1752(+)